MEHAKIDFRYADPRVADAWQQYETHAQEVIRLATLLEDSPERAALLSEIRAMLDIKVNEIEPRRGKTASLYEPGPLPGVPLDASLTPWVYLQKYWTATTSDPLVLQRRESILRACWPYA